MRPEELGRDEDTDTDTDVVLGAVPWLAVTAAEVAGLVAAYRQARMLAAVVRALLVASGAAVEELPVLVATVDAEGRPLVLARRRPGSNGVGTGGQGGHSRLSEGARGRQGRRAA